MRFPPREVSQCLLSSSVRWNKSIRLKQGSSTLWTGVAVCYQALRQYPEMTSSLEEAVRLDPSTRAWFPLGEACAAQNNRQKLVEVYERLKTLRPDLADEFFQKFVLR